MHVWFKTLPLSLQKTVISGLANVTLLSYKILHWLYHSSYHRIVNSFRHSIPQVLTPLWKLGFGTWLLINSMTSESVREWMTDMERNRERVVIDEQNLFCLSSGTDVRNSSYVWYEDMVMGDRYSVKIHLEECSHAVGKELIKNNCLNDCHKSH